AVNGSESLHLALERPVGLVVATDQMRIEWLCLTGTPGSMCADAEWSPVAWSTTVMSNQLPLNALTAGMTPGVEYLGTLNALARRAACATRRARPPLALRAGHRPRLRPFQRRHPARGHRRVAAARRRGQAERGLDRRLPDEPGAPPGAARCAALRFGTRFRRRCARRRGQHHGPRALRMARAPALREISPRGCKSARRGHSRGADRRLPRSRLQRRRAPDRGEREGDRAVREDPTEE